MTIVVAGSGEVIAGEGAAKAFVQRTGDTSAALTVLYEVAGADRSGVEYKPVSNTVTIPAGATRAKIKILGNPDVARIEVIDNH